MHPSIRIACISFTLAVIAPKIHAQCSQQEILGPPIPSAAFGYSVELLPDVLFVGAPGIDAVYVYTRTGFTWVPAGAPLTGIAGSSFGFSLAAHGQWLLIGAPQAAGGGAVDVWFAATPGVYAHHSTLTQTNPQIGAEFGFDVAIEGTTAVVGAPNYNAAGRVDRYSITGGNQFVFAEPLTGISVATAGDRFGHAVAIGGNTLVATAPRDDLFGSTNNGSWSIWRRIGTTWTYKSTHGFSGSSFLNAGWSVDVQADRIIIGKPGMDGFMASECGYQLMQWNGAQYVDVGGSAEPPTIECGLAVAIDLQRFGETRPKFNFESPSLNQPNGSGAFSLHRTKFLDLSTPITNVNSGHAFSLDDQHASLGTALSISGVWTAVGASRSDEAALDAGAVYIYDADLMSHHTDNLATGLGISSSVYGEPVVRAYGSLCDNEALLIRLTQAAPNRPVLLIAGLGYANVPFNSGALGPTLDVLLTGFMTSAAGNLDLSAIWPGGLPALSSIYLQCLISDPTAPLGISATKTFFVKTPN